MPTVTSLHIYPIKSCRGMDLSEVELDDRGPLEDRRWMVVDERNDFYSQRNRPALALVRVELTDRGVAVEAPGMPRLEVERPARGAHGEDFTADVWGTDAPVRPAAPDAHAWFTRYVGTPARLVHLPDDGVRVMKDEYAGAIRERRRVTLNDGAPLLLTTEESLEDLNRRLEAPLRMNRFRPNVVVRGVGAFAEDHWTRVRIGDVTFEVAKPCARCATTTVEQETAERGKEPLRTLSTFRRAESGVLFGQNVAHHAPGRLRVGDELVVLSA
jgi:uncharacterized protein YcbX